MSAEAATTAEVIEKPQSYEELQSENRRLLNELEMAYKNMERILEESTREKEIAYSELQDKFNSMEKLYSELSKKENMLIHMEKLSSIGQFITELIHELSSPLTAITLQAQLSSMRDFPEEIKKQFRGILDYSERMSNLLGRFKAMAYKGKEDFKEFDLNRNVQECMETIEIIKPKYIKIEKQFWKSELRVKGDPYQTHQIFLNLAKNAFDAMKHSNKTLTVKTRKVNAEYIENSGEISDIFCQPKHEWDSILRNNDQFALVELMDEGEGIPSEIMQEIFQPFFTTKERGKGTGLGLAISKDIALRHGGNLAVKSVPEEGTTFQFLVPLRKG